VTSDNFVVVFVFVFCHWEKSICICRIWYWKALFGTSLVVVHLCTTYCCQFVTPNTQYLDWIQVLWICYI